MLGYQTNSYLYKIALIHKSHNQKTNNEKLEFLGDAVLSSIVSEMLFLENPKKEEGFLSQKRATIISRKHLNIVAKSIIPEEEIKSNLQYLPLSVFGNTLEAIIGAIYIDKGMEKTRYFVKKNIYNSNFLEELLDIDFKSKLLKHSQKKGVEIEYRVIKKKGLEHQKEFLIAVFFNGKKIAQGHGKSKKEAEQKAAKRAVNILFCQ